MQEFDTNFAGSIPALYDRYLAPLIFEPYAADLAQRLDDVLHGDLLEIAAGTGVATRALAHSLPASVKIVATDLNQPMLDYAAARFPQKRPVTWRQANAVKLPFDDGSFDVVVCQFGAMFFPDKSAAYREAWRVLKPGGRFVFSVWDRIEENEVTHAAVGGVAGLFPNDPPQFMSRTPHGYHDKEGIASELSQSGFSSVRAETVQQRSRAATAREAAIGLCQGTPLRNEIEARDANRLHEATDAAEAAITARLGAGPIDGKMQAHVITAAR